MATGSAGTTGTRGNSRVGVAGAEKGAAVRGMRKGLPQSELQAMVSLRGRLADLDGGGSKRAGKRCLVCFFSSSGAAIDQAVTSGGLRLAPVGAALESLSTDCKAHKISQSPDDLALVPPVREGLLRPMPAPTAPQSYVQLY